MRNKIIKEALKLFAKNGYENSSLEEIANELKITKPAIYYYFKSKKSLYNEVFKNSFQGLKFELKESLEENLKHYINTLSLFFIKNPDIAKLFSKELSCDVINLEDESLEILSNTIKHLNLILEKENVNPLFIQTLIMSSFTTYLNTINLRNRIKKIVQNEKLKDFDIAKEIYFVVISYIKGNR